MGLGTAAAMEGGGRQQTARSIPPCAVCTRRRSVAHACPHASLLPPLPAGPGHLDSAGAAAEPDASPTSAGADASELAAAAAADDLAAALTLEEPASRWSGLDVWTGC